MQFRIGITLGDPAGMADVGLQHRKCPFAERLEEHPFAHPTFAGCDGRAGAMRQAGQHADTFNRHGLFDKERPVGSKRLNHL